MNGSLGDSLRRCHCNTLHNHWAGQLKGKPSHPARLVAYIRFDGDESSAKLQRDAIDEFCQTHGYEVVAVFQEHSASPGPELTNALAALDRADGLIAADLNRFVHNPLDRLRDLKPLIHDFFCYNHRYLLTVREGIDTSSPSGQRNAVELLSSVKDYEN